MSYERPRLVRRRGMGEIPAAGNSLPPWQQAPYLEFVHSGETFGRVGSDAVLNAIVAALQRLKAAPPGIPARVEERDWLGSPRRMNENAAFLQSLKNFWVRMGRIPEKWPGGRNEYDFGPNGNNGQDLHISKALYEQLRDPRQMWFPASDGWVHLRQSDPLYAVDIRNRLLRDGYMTPNDPVSVQDGSAMVRALARYYDESPGVVDLGNFARWDFGGPGANGDEIRLSDKMLTNLLAGNSPRHSAAVAAGTTLIPGAVIKKPLFGALIGPPAQPMPMSPIAIRAATYQLPAGIMTGPITIPTKK